MWGCESMGALDNMIGGESATLGVTCFCPYCLQMAKDRGLSAGWARSGSLATAWHSNKFLDPITDGAVLPILHLNGFKISNPTVLSHIEHDELNQFLRGCGWTPYFVEGDEPEKMHQLMAATIDKAVEDIQQFQKDARTNNDVTRPRWPMIVLKWPKGWTGPKFVDGLQIEGTSAPIRCLCWWMAIIPTTSSCSRTG
jgi:phosphoketolase